MAKQILKRILFTSAGRRVELVRAFQEAAVRCGIPVWIIGADLSETAPALFFCDEAVQVCRISEEDYIPRLLQICREKRVELLIPTIDTDLLKLSETREQFEAIGTRVFISAPDKIRLCRDKRFTADFFHSCGLLSPDPVDRVEAYTGSYPCFIKPLDGSSSIDAYKAEDQEKLKAFASKIGEGNYIIQPFIEGREYTIDIFCDFDGHPLYISPRERLAVRSGEVLKTRMLQDRRMLEEAGAIIRAFHPAGPITVQLIREKDTGKDYFIEINPRFGGGAPLSMKAGADMAGAALRLLMGETLSEQTSAVRDGETYSRFDDSICLEHRDGAVLRLTTGEAVTEEIRRRVEDGTLLGVLFDLDDTLYSEYDYIKSGFRFAAREMAGFGAPQGGCPTEEELYEQLLGAYHEGKPAIDTVLRAHGWSDEQQKKRCLDAYRLQTPDIALYPWVQPLLCWLREQGIPTGIVTDGRPEGQRAKLSALGLYDLVDEIVITDELGGPQFRKPCDIAFRILQLRFDLPAHQLIYVGNNPTKDLKAPRTLGMRTLFFDNPACIHSW